VDHRNIWAEYWFAYPRRASDSLEKSVSSSPDLLPMPSLVSIIIPCYNAAQWLPQTLESALEQTWENYEIILVDDGSTDDSVAVARQFEERGVRVIEQQNRGASAARNCGLEHASGDFIQYLDADDLLSSDKITRQMEALNDAPEGSLATCAWGRFVDDPETAQFHREPLWADFPPTEFLITAWTNLWMMQPGVWLVPRAVSDAAGRWDESLSLDDDGEYFARVVLASAGVKFVDDAKVYYRSGLSTNLASTRSPKALQSGFTSVQKATQHLLAVDDSPEAKQACANRFQLNAYGSFPSDAKLANRAEAEAQKLGGGNISLPGGKMLKLLSSIIGWRPAMRLHGFVSRYR
jgi:GT2 family glycosyltransferase